MLPLAFIAQSEAKRAKVVLSSASHPDWTDAQVAKATMCSPALVRKWRKRWCQTRTLKEAPRSGRPRTFFPSVRSQVTAIACTRLSDLHLPLARWSCSDIAAQLVALEIVVRDRHRHRMAMAQSRANQTLAVSRLDAPER
ncbi:MAG: helix-turn-helix domain-containing protein [Rhizonema sp. PD37]|nr:helix-turn-helix domain-containing protein [Rhizonema sp. PD37]